MKAVSEGFKVVLTAEGATASDTLGATVAGFISALPDSYIKPLIARTYFRVKSRNGIAERAPYGLAKVEASLVAKGVVSRDEVAIASPYELDKVIGPNTRVLGIYVMDPLGLSFGSGIVYWILKLAGLPYRGIPFIARSFLEIFTNPAVKAHRSHMKIVVGGPATWQLTDTGYHRKLGVDVVYEGEFESLGPSVFSRLLRGEPLPPVVSAPPAKPEDIATILTPSNGGLVEVTRGCGRGCAFCTPALSGAIKSLPFEGHIDQEIRVNIGRGGMKDIDLHSDEFFRYGAKGIEPNPEKVIELTRKAYKLVKSYGDEHTISTNFTTAAVAAYKPKMVEEVAQYINEGGRRTFIEMGIETGSPRLLRKLMPGKALPYTPEQYPEVVEQAIGILNDNGWVVVGTMILNLPGETEDDVVYDLELLDRIKKLRVITFPLPFIPMGALRHTYFTILNKMLLDPVRGRFILEALSKAFSEAAADMDMAVEKMENPLAKIIIGRLGKTLASMLVKRYEEAMRELASRRLKVPEVSESYTTLRTAVY
ncbi:B12-binding domain-containing radical SAM protein [Acidilobus sp.]|uniref:B12-binding domain-containing radical SAM protein n=1 Tax=Acidilobus sp. TaxID=1872109 RepID=UPI003D062810